MTDEEHVHHHENAHDHQHDHAHEAGLRAWVKGLFRPHTHDTADTVAAALTGTDEGMRALKISLGVLALTAAVQLVVVVVSGSVALLADSIHNVADALTAVPLAVAFWLGRRAPTKRYTYGFGRAEDLAGAFIVAMIALSSAVAAWEALQRLAHPQDVRHLAWVGVAGLVGFVGNETVARYRIRVGRKIGSAALLADGLHARTDGFTSLAVVVGAAGVAAGWRLADPVVGLLITIAILVVLKNAAVSIYRRLMDAVEPELIDKIESTLVAVDGVEAVDLLRVRWVGHELYADIEIVSDVDLSFAEAHAVAHNAQHRLLHDVPRLAGATIHTNPCGHNGHDPHATISHHS